MKITNNSFYIILILLPILSSLLIIKKIGLFGMIPLILLSYYLIFPGFLLLQGLGISLTNRINQIVHSVGLSLSIIMFGGLMINGLLPFFGIQKPITPLNTFIFLNTFILIVGSIVCVKNRKKYFNLHQKKIDITNSLFSIIPIIFIFQSLIGAVILNNGGPSNVSIALLLEIVLYCVMIVVLEYRLNKNIIYPLAVYSISTSILLMLSMRSTHIVGWDINQEYYVFQLTKKLSYWTMSNFRDAYNACLSITILPTILSSLVKINNEYIFKLLFPLLFSFAPVGLYYLIKNFVKENIALLSVLIFIFQPQFILEIVMLARQEIAILYLVLLLFIFFTDTLSDRKKPMLFIIYYYVRSDENASFTQNYVSKSI